MIKYAASISSISASEFLLFKYNYIDHCRRTQVHTTGMDIQHRPDAKAVGKSVPCRSNGKSERVGLMHLTIGNII